MVLEEYPNIVVPGMEFSMELAVEAYDALGDDFAEPIDLPDSDVLRKSARWAMKVGDRLTGLDLLSGSTQRRIFDAARNTITANASREPGARFGRQYNGNGKCDFCPMLASRGAVYLTADSAGEAVDFHDNCHCEIYVERP